MNHSEYYSKLDPVKESVTASEAADRMRKAGWEEQTISLLLKHKDIPTGVPIGKHLLTICPPPQRMNAQSMSIAFGGRVSGRPVGD